MKEKNNNWWFWVIIVLGVIVICLSGFILYDKCVLMPRINYALKNNKENPDLSDNCIKYSADSNTKTLTEQEIFINDIAQYFDKRGFKLSRYNNPNYYNLYDLNDSTDNTSDEDDLEGCMYSNLYKLKNENNYIIIYDVFSCADNNILKITNTNGKEIYIKEGIFAFSEKFSPIIVDNKIYFLTSDNTSEVAEGGEYYLNVKLIEYDINTNKETIIKSINKL